MKIIKANEAAPGVSGYICHLTDLEAKVLKDMCRKVSSPILGEAPSGHMTSRGMLSALGSVGVMAPVTYFSGALQAI